MSNDSFNNPYQSTSNAAGQFGGVPAGAKPKRPGAFMAVAIVSLIFGIMGLMQGCCGAVAVAGQGAMFEFPINLIQESGAPDADEQVEALKVTQEIGAKFMILNILMLSISLVVSILMLVGGIMGIQGKAASKPLLLGSSFGGILMQCITPVSTFLQGQATIAMLNDMGASTPQNVGRVVIQLGIAIGFAILMIPLYATAIGYLMASKKTPEFFAKKAALRN